MTKRMFNTALLCYVIIVAVNVFSACKKDKDENPSIGYKEYRLYNSSSGSPVDAGSFRLDQLSNGNAKITISISLPFRQSNATFEAVINKEDASGNELVFSNLGLVNGNTGSLVTNPVMSSGSNLPVKYTDLVGQNGYFVKVLNGANVQARGDIE
ncbi:MAG: hypothetical protein QM768_16790 [Agriterribacter sp.]